MHRTAADEIPHMNDPYQILHHDDKQPLRGSIISTGSFGSMVSLDEGIPLMANHNAMSARAVQTDQDTTSEVLDGSEEINLPKNARPTQPSVEREYFERIWAQNFERSEATVAFDAKNFLPVGVPARLNRIQGFSLARDEMTHRIYAVYRLEIENIIKEKQWTIYRRFDDFKHLYQQLRVEVLHVPPLPTRTWKRSLETPFLQKRQLELDRWLREVLMLVSLETCRIDQPTCGECECGKQGLHASVRIIRYFLMHSANEPPKFEAEQQSANHTTQYANSCSPRNLSGSDSVSSDCAVSVPTGRLTRGTGSFSLSSKSLALAKKLYHTEIGALLPSRPASAQDTTNTVCVESLERRLHRTSIADSESNNVYGLKQNNVSSIRRNIVFEDVDEDSQKAEALSTEEKPRGLRRPGHVSLRDFDVLRMIGKGSFGKVLLIRKKQTLQLYAVKILDKSFLMRKQQVEHTKTERRVLASITHPFIVCLHYAFQSKSKLFFVLDYCPGGDLFFHLSRTGCFPEHMAKFFVAEIVLALMHLHEEGIAYRDLKPENIMLDVEGHVKLADFGLAKEGIRSHLNGTYTMCGTPEYLPPEILSREGHGTAVDWWNLGMVLYELLTGRPPWYTQDREELFDRLRGAELEFPEGLSVEAMDLIQGLLTRDPSERLGASDPREVTYHPFFADIDWNALYNRQVTPPYRPCLYTDPIDAANFEEEFTKLPLAQIDGHGLCVTAESSRPYVSNTDSALANTGHCFSKQTKSIVQRGSHQFVGSGLGASMSQRNSDLRNLSYTFAGFTYEGRSFASSGGANQ
uniref:Protein kinase putative n=1 Tax=Albugo laibachii Nc14 TaxID=890382 RepID=F0WDC8_9STRA|nr:protein kinase putative [Albugo laibachii Nc14]|eukprot:CCA19200.1 protein kinase putative [Albugo laibachii Nc14]